MLPADSPFPVPAPPVPDAVPAAGTATVIGLRQHQGRWRVDRHLRHQAKGLSWNLFHQNNPRNDRARDHLDS